MEDFLLEYDLDGSSWGFTVKAVDWADAARRLSALAGARILGPLGATVPFDGLATDSSDNALPPGVRARPKLTVVSSLPYQKD